MIFNTTIVGGAAPTLITKSITANGTYNAEDDSADGYSSVSVTVPTVTATSLSVTSNGTYTAPAGTAYTPVTVNVSGGGNNDFKAFIGRTSGSPSLPSDLTTIGNYAFYTWTNLALTSLPSTVTTIGDSAFYNCANLALTSLPSGVTTIGASAFYGCKNLTLTSLPSTVTTIGTSAFSGCTNLALTSLPSSVTTLGGYAFYNCTNLELTNIPSSVNRLNSYVFYGCTKLVSISGDGILQIDSGAFLKCSSLESARFPNASASSLYSTTFGNSTAASACTELAVCDLGKTKQIAANAFINCYKLRTLILRKTDAITTLANVSAFTNTPMNGYNSQTGTVYVPSALISTYQTATNWSTLYNNGTVSFVAIEGSQYQI